MNPQALHLSYGHGPASQHDWHEGLCALGIDTRADPQRSLDSGITRWNVGPMALISADLRHHAITPVSPDKSPWTHDHLFLKLVYSGSVLIEQDGCTHAFGPGHLVLIDPAEPYHESVPERAIGLGLRFPRAALRERGFRDRLRGIHVPDVSSPDVQAVRELFECLGRQSGAASVGVRRRMGELLLDLMDIVVSNRDTARPGRGAAAVVYKAKRFIARHAGDAELKPSQIAAHACVSEKYLSRLFSAEGTSLMRYVLAVRLERAAGLLAATPWQRNLVQQVAFQCGFASTSHFSHVFKERYGVAPSEAGSLQGFASNVHEAASRRLA
jgi:AraC-like DNA-binding protein